MRRLARWRGPEKSSARGLTTERALPDTAIGKQHFGLLIRPFRGQLPQSLRPQIGPAFVGKIALSMGQVKPKPQYLVLRWRSGEPKPQTLRFCLWKAPIPRALFGFERVLQVWLHSFPGNLPPRSCRIGTKLGTPIWQTASSLSRIPAYDCPAPETRRRSSANSGFSLCTTRQIVQIVENRLCLAP
jgi:hypothetical protein